MQVCFKRNVHQRDQDTISDLAALYEPTPNLFTQILVESLFDLPKQKQNKVSNQCSEARYISYNCLLQEL